MEANKNEFDFLSFYGDKDIKYIIRDGKIKALIIKFRIPFIFRQNYQNQQIQHVTRKEHCYHQ